MFLDQCQFGDVFGVEVKQQRYQGAKEDVSKLVNKQHPHGILERAGTMLIESDKKHR